MIRNAHLHLPGEETPRLGGPDEAELQARRVRDYEYFRWTKLAKGSCAYANAGRVHTRSFRGYVGRLLG
jgi:hypothetical protein